MLHRHERVVDADHPADLARPQAAGVDDVLGGDRALLGLHAPLAARQWRERQHAVVLDHLGAARLRAAPAYAYVAPFGSRLPSCGSNSAPYKPARVDDRHHLGRLLRVTMKGHRRPMGAEPRELVASATPSARGCRRARARRTSGGRSPARLSARPGDRCRSCTSAAPRSRVSALIAWNPPAACHVDPAVSSSRSIRTTSVRPRSVRW